MSNKQDELKSAILGPEAPEAPKAPVAPQAPVLKAESKKVLTPKEKKELAEKNLVKKVEEAFENADKNGVSVVALEKGSYPAGRRRAVGDVFKVKSIQHFSYRWMKLAE